MLPMLQIPRQRQTLYRAACAVFLLLVACLPLWQPSPAPARAVTIGVVDSDAPAADGSCTFTVRLTTSKGDVLPIAQVDLRIYNTASPEAYSVTLRDLPLPYTEETTLYTDYAEAGSAASVVAASGPNWTSGFASRYGYGYSYEYHTWTYLILSMRYAPESRGYGYEPGTSGGEASVTYTVTWTAPEDWPAGGYSVEVLSFGSLNARVDGDTTLAFTNEVVPSFDIPEWRSGTTVPPSVTAPATTSAAATTAAVSAPSSPAATSTPSTTAVETTATLTSPSSNWWLVVVIVVAVVIGAAAGWFLLRPRRR